MDAGAIEIQRLLDAYDSVTKISTGRVRGGGGSSSGGLGSVQLDPTLVTRLAAHNPTYQ